MRQSINLRAFKRVTAGVLAAIYFLMNVPLSHAAEVNMWEQRRRDLSEARRSQDNRLAALPAILSNPLPSSISSVSRPEFRKRASSIDPRLASLSFREATIREVWTAPGSRKAPVVLVQDIHLNTEAQENISSALMEIDRAARMHGGKALIGVEGAFGPFSFRRFHAFPDREFTSTIARFFLEKGAIAAPSFVGITETVAPVFHGIDDPKQYEENVEAYRESLPVRASVRAEILGLKKALVKKKESLNPRLKQFDALNSAYAAGDVGLGAYVRGLNRLAVALPDGSEVPARDLVLEQFLTALELEEKLDMPRVEKEKSAALAILSEKAERAELETLAGAAVAYRSGRLSYADFFGALRGLLIRHQVPLSRMPAFDAYLRYIALADGINTAKLFLAVRSLERQTMGRLAQSTDEMGLMERTRELVLADKIADFALTPDEWQEYKQRFLSNRESPSKEFLSLRPRLSSFESFYRAADFRSARLVENLISAAGDTNASITGMIIGGFHTPMIAQYLQGRGISYAVIQVRLTKIDGIAGNEYLSAFSREKTPLENLLAGERLNLAPRTTAVGTSDSAALPALLRLIAPLVLRNRSIPNGAEVARTEEDGVTQITIPESPVPVAMSTRKAPAGWRVVETVVVPVIGAIQFLARRPSISEMRYAVIPLAFLSVGPHAFALVALFSAIAFAFIHDNTDKETGRFSWSAFVVRAMGTFGILSLAWASGGLIDIGSGAEAINLLQLGLAALVIGILHEAWNLIMPKEFELSLTPEERRASARAHLRQMEAFPEIRDLLAAKGTDALTPEERATVIGFNLRAFGLRSKRPLPQSTMTPRMLRAFQNFEIESFRSAARSALKDDDEEAVKRLKAETQARLDILSNMYEVSEEDLLPIFALNAINDVITDRFVPGGRRVSLGLPGRSPEIFSLRISVSGQAVKDFATAEAKSDLAAMTKALDRIVDGPEKVDLLARFEAAVNARLATLADPAKAKSDLAAIAKALDRIVDGPAKVDLVARFESAVNARLATIADPTEAAELAESFPPEFRRLPLERAAVLALELLANAPDLATADRLLGFLRVEEPRLRVTDDDTAERLREFRSSPQYLRSVRARELRDGVAAAEKILNARGIPNLWPVVQKMRVLPETNPLRQAAEDRWATLSGTRRTPVQEEPAPVDEPENVSEPEVVEAPVAREPVRTARPRNPQNYRDHAFDRASAASVPNYLAERSEALSSPAFSFFAPDAENPGTPGEYAMLQVYLMVVNGVTPVLDNSLADMTGRLLVAIRNYESQRVAKAPATTPLDALKTEAERRFAALREADLDLSEANPGRTAAMLVSEDPGILVPRIFTITLRRGSVNVSMLATQNEVALNRFDDAEGRNDLVALIRAFNMSAGDLRDDLQARLEAFVQRALPGISNVQELDRLQNALPVALRDLVSDRRVDVIIDALGAAQISDDVDALLDDVPGDHPRRADAVRLRAAIMAATDIVALRNIAGLRRDLTLAMEALPETSPARKEAEDRITLLSERDARSRLEDGIQLENVKMIRDAIADLPEDQRGPAQLELHRIAAGIVAKAPDAAAITKDVLDSLEPAQRANAAAKKDALTAVAAMAGNPGETPGQHLRRISRDLKRLTEGIAGSTGLPRLEIFVSLLDLVERLKAAGLGTYFNIPDGYSDRVRDEIVATMEGLVEAMSTADTADAFEVAVQQMRAAMTAIRNAGLDDTFGVDDESRQALRQDVYVGRVTRLSPAMIAAMTEFAAEAVRVGYNPSAVRNLVRGVRVTTRGVDLDRLNWALTRIAQTREELEGRGDRFAPLVARILTIEDLLERFATAAQELDSINDAAAPRAPPVTTPDTTPVAPTTPPAVTPPVTPPTTPTVTTNPGDLGPENRRSMWTLRIIALVAVVGIMILMAVYAPDVSQYLLRLTDLTYTPSAAAGTATGIGIGGFWLLGARVTYLTVRFALIFLELGYRLIVTVARRLLGMNGAVSFIDRDGRTVRNDGVIVDFLSSSETLKAALMSRFGATGAELAPLNRSQLMALWYRLDAEDARLERVQDRLEQEQRAAEERKQSWAKWLLLLPISIPVHLFRFLRDFFFQTDIRRIRYNRQGRFINHFVDAEQGRRLVAAAVSAVSSQKRGMSVTRSVSAWYFRNNIAFAGLAGYMYRRLRITIFGMIGGWIVGGIGLILPGFVSANMTNWINSHVPHAVAKDGFLYRYFSVAVHHLSFSSKSVMTTFFTAFGLNLDTQLRRVHAAIMQKVASPLGAATRADFDAVESGIRGLAAAPVATGDDLAQIIDIAARTEALIQTQRMLPWYSLKRFSLGRYSDDEATVLRDAIGAMLERHVALSALSVSERAEFDAVLDYRTAQMRVAFAAAPGFFSMATLRALWADIKTGRFWGAQMRSMWGMWTLGAEIALVVELSGDIGYRLGQGVGYVSTSDPLQRSALEIKGEVAGRNAANILEGENASAMSLMSDLQVFALGKFGLLPPPGPALAPDAPGAPAGPAPGVRAPRFDVAPELPFDPRIPTDARDFRWIESDLFASASKWALLQRVMRERGMAWSAENGRPVELPTLPVDRNGIPIRMVTIGGLPLDGDIAPELLAFRLADGTNIPVREAIWDPVSRTYAPPAGKTFEYIRLDPGEAIAYTDNRGRPLHDISGRRMSAVGFRVHDPAVMNGTTVYWRDGQGRMSRTYVKDRPAVPVNPLSGDEVILEASIPANEAAVATAQRNRDLSANRLELTRQRLADVRNIAYEVDADFKIIKMYADYKDLPKLKFFRYPPGGGALVEFDPRVDGDISADVIRTEDGKEIVFTAKADREALIARQNAAKAKTDAVGAWAMGSWPVGTADPRNVHNALLNLDRSYGAYMIIKFPNGNLAMFNDVRSASRALQSAGVPGQRIAAFTNDRQFQGLSNGELIWNGAEFHNNDSEKFYELLLEWYHQQNPPDPRAAVARADLGGPAVFTDDEIRRFNADATEVSRANRNAQSGGPFNHRGRVVFLVPVSAQKAVGDRTQNVNFTMVLTQAQMRDWEDKMVITLPGGRELVRPVLGYVRDENGRITRQFTNPVTLHRELQRTDLIYELSDGRKLPMKDLPPNMREQNITVTGIIDPRTNETIVTGSGWARLNFMAATRIRIEQHGKGVPPALIGTGVVTVDADGIPQARTTTLQGIRYDISLEAQWMIFLTELRAKIDGERNPNVRRRLEEVYQKSLQRRMFTTNYTQALERGAAATDFVIIKGTYLQTVEQSERELMIVLGALGSEDVRRNSGGMRVIQGGEELEELRGMRIERDMLAVQLETRRKRLAEVRIKARRQPGALTDDDRWILQNGPAIILKREKELAAYDKEIADLVKKRATAIRRARLPEEGAESFGANVARYRAALELQKDYIKTLQADLKKNEDLLVAARALRAAERDPKVQAELDESIALLERKIRMTELRIKNALGEDSFVFEGVKYMLIAPWREAEERANLLTRRWAAEREALIVMEQVMAGKPVAVRRDVDATGVVTIRIARQEDFNAVRAAHVAEMRDRAARLPIGPDQKARMLDRANRIEAGLESFQVTNRDGTRTEWTMLRSGVAVHVITNARGESEIHFDTMERGEALKAARVDQLQQIIRDPRAPLARVRAQRELDEIQNNNTLSYWEGGERHQWTLVYSLPDAERELEQRQARLNAAQILLAARGTHIWDVGPDGKTVIVSDPKSVTDIRAALETARQELRLAVDRKRGEIQSLRDRGMDSAVAEADLLKLTARLQDAERGIFEKDGHRYVINYSLEETRQRHLAVARRAFAATPAGTRSFSLLDANNVVVGDVITNGRHFIVTEGRVVSEPKDGLVEVEIRTYTSRSAPTRNNMGVLFSISRVFVDGQDRIAAQVTGHLDAADKFVPRTISFNDYIPGVSQAVGGRTYRYVEGLALADYPKRPELFLDSSRSLTRAEDIARTGLIEIELTAASGSVWRETRDASGRVLQKIEGRAEVDATGRTVFTPVRRLISKYDNPDFAMHNIPSSTETYDYFSNERMGVSLPRSSYDDFSGRREVLYERWVEKTKEMVWEVRNSDGLLVRKYALEPVGDGRGGVAYVPYNVTIFAYNFAGDGHGSLGLADAAYTFETDSNGMLEGGIDPRTISSNPSTGPYFEHTEIVKVSGDGPRKRIVYRVSVRNGDRRDFEQFQEVKNGDGELLERHVGHRSGPRSFIPEEITLNAYNDGRNGYGRYGLTHRSKTFSVRFDSGYEEATFDLSNLRLDPGVRAVAFDANGNMSAIYVLTATGEGNRWVDTRTGTAMSPEVFARVPLGDNVSRMNFTAPSGATLFSITLKEQSDIDSVDATGHLKYRREVYRFNEQAGVFRRVVHSTYVDTIYQGAWKSSYNRESDSESRVDFDHKKVVVRGSLTDRSEHPSLLGGTGRDALIEETNRLRKGFMPNPYLPDMPSRFWIVFEVIKRNRSGEVVYRGTRWVDVYGRTGIDVADKKSAEGQPQAAVAIHLSDNDELTYAVREIRPGMNRIPTTFAAGVDGRPVDIRDSDFVYLQIESASNSGRETPAATLVFRDAAGREVRVGDGTDIPFWLPASANTLRVADSDGEVSSSVQLVANSPYLQKRFVLAVPVSELRRAGLDVSSLRQEVSFEATNPGPATELLKISRVYRAGRVGAERRAGEQPFEERNDRSASYQMVSPSGRTAFYDATTDSKEGSGVPLFTTDSGHLAGVIREYRYKSERGGIPVQQRRLIVYDKSGTFPIASVRLIEANGRIVPDMNDVISFAVREEGNRVIVYSVDPTNNYPYEVSYRVDAIQPGTPEVNRVGDLSVQRNQSEGPVGTAANRLENSPFQILNRWIRGERMGIATPTFNASPLDIQKAVDAMDWDQIQAQNAKLNERDAQLPEDQKPVKAADVKPWTLKNLVSPLGVIFLMMILSPFALMYWSYLNAKKWTAWRAMLDKRRARRAADNAPLYGEDVMTRAMKRFSDNILETKVRATDADGNPLLVTSDGDIEGAFLFNLSVIYQMAFAANERAGRAEDSQEMRDLDAFAKAISTFLTEEIGRGSDPSVVRRPVPGKVDPAMWGKLEILLTSFRDRAKVAFISDRREGAGVTTRTDAVLRDLYQRTTADGKFNGEMLANFIKTERFGAVPAAFIWMGRHLVKFVPVLVGVLVFRGLDLTTGASTLALIVLASSFLFSLVFNSLTEANAIRSGRFMSDVGRLRAIAPVITILAAIYIVITGTNLSAGAFMLLTFVTVVMFMETLGILLPRAAIVGGNRSLLGVASYYHLRRPFSVGRPRAIVMSILIFVIFVIVATTLGTAVLPWFLDKFASGSLLHTAIALIHFSLGMPLLHHGVNLGVRFIASAFFPTLGAGETRPDDLPAAPSSEKTAVVHVGGNPMTSGVIAKADIAGTTKTLTATFMALLQETGLGRGAVELLIKQAIQDPRLGLEVNATETDEQKAELVRKWLTVLHTAEVNADSTNPEGSGTTLWSLRQMYDLTMPDMLKVGQNLSPQEQAQVEFGFKVRRSLMELMGGGKIDPKTGRVGIGGSSLDTAMNFMEMAEGIGDAGLAPSMWIQIISNQYEKHDDPKLNPSTIDETNRSELGQRKKLCLALSFVSRRTNPDGSVTPGLLATSMYDHTVFGMKSSAMNVDRMMPEELPKVKSILITDRNASYLNIPSFIRDLRRMRDNKNIVIMVAQRNTTYTADAMGRTSFAIEGGHGESMKSISDKIGTGWGNFMRVLYWDVMKEFAKPEAAFRSWETEGKGQMAQLFGLLGFTPNAVGISEDYWGVLQQYHNMVGMGMTPELALTASLAHKARESRDYAEWAAAPWRWSSGLVATIEELVNQQINEFGPDSIFEKEIRQTNADHYLLGPLVLYSLFMLPISVVADLSPFVGLAIISWGVGVILNQISTPNSLLANIRHMGFWPGLSRWLRDRVPDAELFAPRTVRDALAQDAGYKGPSLEFKASGGAASDDALKTIFGVPDDEKRPVIWIIKNWRVTFMKVWKIFFPAQTRTVMFTSIGIFGSMVAVAIGLSFVLSPVAAVMMAGGLWMAISYHRIEKLEGFFFTFLVGIALLLVNFVALNLLDATNAVMMILSLWFAVGVAFGPMLKGRKFGVEVANGVGDILARMGGWVVGFIAMFSLSGVLAAAVSGSGIAFVPLAGLVFAVLLVWGIDRASKISVAEKNLKTERLASEARRGFWTFVLFFGWFVFVPVHPLMRFDIIPGMPIIFTPMTFAIIVGVIALVIALIVIKGIRDGDEAKRRVSKRYLDLSAAHGRIRGVSHSFDAQITALLTQTVTFVQQEAYRYADQSLDQVTKLLEGAEARRQIDSARTLIPRGRKPVREVGEALAEAERHFRAGDYRQANWSADRAREYLSVGAMGIWRRLGLTNVTAMGRIEGILSAAFGFALLVLLLPVDGGASLSLLRDGFIVAGMLPLLAPVAVAFTATAAVLGVGHAIFGVDDGRAPPRRDAPTVLNATVTASLPLLFLPVIALGILLGGLPGAIVSILGAIAIAGAHGELNRMISGGTFSLPSIRRFFLPIALALAMFTSVTFVNPVTAQNPAPRPAAVQIIDAETGAVRPILNADDALKFTDFQQDGIIGRLPRTFHVPTKGESRYANERHKYIVERGAGTYDVALDIIRMIEGGKLAEARALLEAYAREKYGDFPTGLYPTAENGNSFSPFTKDKNFVPNIIDASGVWTKKWDFWNTHTGPNAWLVMAAARFLHEDGGINAPRNALIKSLVDRLTGGMELMQAENGGMRYGPKGQFDAAAGKNTDAAYEYFNTENNISAYSAFKTLERVTGDKEYGKKAQKIIDFFTKTEFKIRNREGRWVKQIGLMNKENGTLYMGARLNKDGELEIEDRFATDSGGTWLIAGFGVKQYDEIFGKGAAYRAWVTIRAKAGRGPDYAPTRPGDRLAGLDFTDEIDGRKIDKTSALISNEWTAPLIVKDGLFERMIEHYTDNPAPNVTATEIEGLRKDLESVREESAKNPNVYAHGPGLDGWRGKLGVGFGWIPPWHRLHTAAASMARWTRTEMLAWWRGEAPARIEKTEPVRPVDPVRPVEPVRPEIPVVSPEKKANPPKIAPVTPPLAQPPVATPAPESTFWPRFIFTSIAVLSVIGIVTLIVIYLKRNRNRTAPEPAKPIVTSPEEGDAKVALAAVQIQIQRARRLYASALALLPTREGANGVKPDLSIEALAGMAADQRQEAARLLSDAVRNFDAATAMLDDAEPSDDVEQRYATIERERGVTTRLQLRLSAASERGGSAPGAFGFWQVLGLPDFSLMGRVEGWLSAGVALSILSFFGDPLGFSGIGLAVGGFVLFFAMGHLLTGVDMGQRIPSRSARDIFRATLTASVPVIAVPFLALALSLGGLAGVVVGLMAAVAIGETHAALNRRSAPAARQRSLNDLIQIEKLGLDRFGRAAGRDRSERLAEAFGFGGSIGRLSDDQIGDRLHFINGIAAERPEAVGNAIDLIGETAPAEAERGHRELFVPAPARNAEELARSVNDYLALTGAVSVDVVLVGGNESFAQSARLPRNAAILPASAVETAADLRRMLERTGASPSRLRVIAHKDAALPDAFLNALMELSRSSEAPVAVDIIILAALTATSLAIRAGVNDLEGMLRSRRLVATQA